MRKKKDMSRHNALKEEAKKILRRMGFKRNQIFQEYRVIPDLNHPAKGFRVDVAGIKPNETILIECGNLSYKPDKLNQLRPFCNKVIHLPYLSTITNATPKEKTEIIRIAKSVKKRLDDARGLSKSYSQIISQLLVGKGYLVELSEPEPEKKVTV